MLLLLILLSSSCRHSAEIISSKELPPVSVKVAAIQCSSTLGDAKGNRAKLYLYGSYAPWGIIAAGIAVAAAGGLLVGRGRKRQGDGRHSAELMAEPAGD